MRRLLAATATVLALATASGSASGLTRSLWQRLPSTVRHKVTHGLVLAFAPRPGVEGVVLPAASRVGTIVRFRAAASDTDLRAIERAGGQLPLDRNGQPYRLAPEVLAHAVLANLSAKAVIELASNPRVEGIMLDGMPLGVLPSQDRWADVER